MISGYRVTTFFVNFTPKNTFWGVASPPKVAIRQNQFFFEVLAYLAGFKNYTFFKFFFTPPYWNTRANACSGNKPNFYESSVLQLQKKCVIVQEILHFVF